MSDIIIETDDDCELVTVEDVTILDDIPNVTFLDNIDDTTDLLESIEETSVLDVQVVTDIIDSCLQGPKGAQGDSVAQQFNATVPVGTTMVVDSLSLAVNPSSKWILTALDTTNNLRRFSELGAVHNGTTVCNNHYGIIGDVVPYKAQAILSGGLFFQLQIKNNHTEDLDFKVLRLNTVI